MTSDGPKPLQPSRRLLLTGALAAGGAAWSRPAQLAQTLGEIDAELPNTMAEHTPEAVPLVRFDGTALVTARTNLNETAFFFPQLLSDDDGIVKMTFTMPEALTEWKFLGFAHDASLRSGFLTDKVVTAKDLMVEPNPPRFLREGDTVEFTVKVTNQSDQPQTGTVRLTFTDAATQASVDAALAKLGDALAGRRDRHVVLALAGRVLAGAHVVERLLRAVAFRTRRRRRGVSSSSPRCSRRSSGRPSR